MNGIIKWGIIGLGNVAHEFAKSFYNIKNAKLIAIASKTQNKLSKFKDEFNINPNNCYDEYEKLLKNNEIDIIYIALPNNFGSLSTANPLCSFITYSRGPPSFTAITGTPKDIASNGASPKGSKYGA